MGQHLDSCRLLPHRARARANSVLLSEKDNITWKRLKCANPASNNGDIILFWTRTRTTLPPPSKGAHYGYFHTYMHVCIYFNPCLKDILNEKNTFPKVVCSLNLKNVTKYLNLNQKYIDNYIY